ncbi:MAG: endonuclease [Saprospiraceae bacterium]|nr:endonuclease [Saprospiraceae bacterium]
MKYILSGFYCLFFFGLSAQYDHEGVFPDLEGEDLRAALVANYKTSNVLTYSEARDTFFRNIDAKDNILECVYTGFQITLDPSADPTIDAFSKGINTEHTYPRSKGASENTNAYSDMHHLFPTREQVNADRGSLIFGEVIDSQTDKWYLEDDVITSIPTQGIDLYSELLQGERFEPREKHKGDVARSYFYFYTMYQNQADQAAPNFFGLQQETMCQWHFEDPVDEKEWIRNNKIAEYQDGKKNPFILDCRLARLYCDAIMGSCLTVSLVDLSSIELKIKPNPVHEVIFLEAKDASLERYQILSIDGQVAKKGWLLAEEGSISLEVSGLKNGFYLIQVIDVNGQIKGVEKFVKI